MASSSIDESDVCLPGDQRCVIVYLYLCMHAVGSDIVNNILCTDLSSWEASCIGYLYDNAEVLLIRGISLSLKPCVGVLHRFEM
jgi:hypothetical protein